jgi:hypothetical protein
METAPDEKQKRRDEIRPSRDLGGYRNGRGSGRRGLDVDARRDTGARQRAKAKLIGGTEKQPAANRESIAAGRGNRPTQAMGGGYRLRFQGCFDGGGQHRVSPSS